MTELENLNDPDDLVRQKIANTEIYLTATDISVDTSRAFRLPLDKLTDLGVGFASLPTMFRSINFSVDLPQLLTVTNKVGNPIDPAKLQRFNDGSGIMGSFSDAAKGFGQARFHTFDGGQLQSVATVPFDPTTLFMAAALMQINAKLDSIEKTMDEILRFMEEKEKAKVRGNLVALQGYLNEYRFNWNNATWLANAHKETLEIKRESEQAIIHLRAQVKTKLGDKGLVEIRAMVDNRMNQVLGKLKNCQIALYTYAFAAFLEPMLSENFDKNYLDAVAESISKHGYDYQVLYTECYNAIEQNSQQSADAMVLGGIASALDGLGGLIKKTPVGDVTLIDEALEGAGKELSGINKDLSNELMNRLLEAKTPDVLSFRQSVEAVNELHNQPLQILSDGEAVYLVPRDE